MVYRFIDDNKKNFGVRWLLRRFKLSANAYYNKDLKIKFVTQKKEPNYKHGNAHKKFANLINQDFTATKKNTIWCTDFTYLTLTNGSKRYNCTMN